MSYIPDELTYESSPQPEPVVMIRSETFLVAPADATSSSSSVIRFHITGNQMLDLASLRLYANVAWKRSAGGATIFPNPTAGLFSTLEIAAGSGVVIERLEDCVALQQLVSNLSYSAIYANHAGSFTGNSFQAVERTYDYGIPATADTNNNNVPTQASVATIMADTTQNSQFPIGHPMEIGVLKLSGFLHSGKFINPNAFGGLVITLTMAPATQVAYVYPATASCDCRLSNIKLYYDMCTMTPAYQEWFDQQYMRKGFRVVFDSYMARHKFTPTGPGVYQIPLSGRRVKGCMAVIRDKAHATTAGGTDNEAGWRNASTNFLAIPQPNYSIEISGQRFPPSAIDSIQRAHNETLKLCYASHDVQRCAISYYEFTKSILASGVYIAATTNPLYAGTTAGKFVMCVDFEKYTSSGESGVSIPPSGFSLSFGASGLVTEGAAPVDPRDQDLTVYLIRSQAVSVFSGQVVLDY